MSPYRSSRIRVGIAVDQRRKGLLWYNLYDVTYAASYEVTFDLPPGQATTIDLSYRSRGTGSWAYHFRSGDGVESIDDFAMDMTTDFTAIDFPSDSLLPTGEKRVGDGYQLRWNYATLVTGKGIGLTIPIPLQPGPLAQRITLWAPVALLFYFAVLLLITTLRGTPLHPMNYAFLACAFFAFHLLFAYLVDRIPVETAFTICSVVSMFLTISYLRLVAGWRFAVVESALQRRVERTNHHDRSDRHALHCHATHRAHPMGRVAGITLTATFARKNVA